MRGKSVALLAPVLLLLAAAAAPVAIPNPGFEEGRSGEPAPEWHTGIAAAGTNAAPSFPAVIDTEKPRSGHASVRLESPKGQIADSDFGTVTNAIDATALRGRRVRLTGAVRAAPGDDGRVGLWLRVDRGDGLIGFFDNMDGRPITSSDWADYSIEGDVAADAKQLVFGLLLIGHGRAWLDDVRIEDIGPAHGTGLATGWESRPRNGPAPGDVPPHPLSRQGLVDLHAFARLYGLVRFFHPSDEAAAADWNSLALAGIARVESARNPKQLAADLRAVFAPVAPSIEIYATATPPKRAGLRRPAGAVDAVHWHHLGYGDDPGHVYSSERVATKGVQRDDLFTVSLPGGVSARVPLAVWRDAHGATLPHSTAVPPDAGKPAGFVPAGFDRTTRLAAIVAAWSIYRHFDPYSDLLQIEWDRTLDKELTAAAIDGDDLAFRDTLRRLVAALHDGHGSVPYYQPKKGVLPLAWDWVEGQLVLTAVGEKVDGPRRGDVVVSIDGVPVASALAKRMALESGSPQWTRVRGLADLLTGPPDRYAVLTVRNASGTRKVRLPYRSADTAASVTEPKPEPIAELSPGLLYVDIDRVSQAAFDARMDDLAHARGLIFDLRGYPKMSPAFLQHFSGHVVQSGHFVSLAFDRPDRPGTPASDGQWNMPPLAPRFTSNVAFITDGSAISYSESVLSVVAGNRLAEIVGSPSAGANGNITFADLPGGYQISWTGMRVTNRDGSRHYLLGVQPTIPVRRTLAGVRAGRDELLDRAIAVVKAKMAAAAD